MLLHSGELYPFIGDVIMSPEQRRSDGGGCIGVGGGAIGSHVMGWNRPLLHLPPKLPSRGE